MLHTHLLGVYRLYLVDKEAPDAYLIVVAGGVDVLHAFRSCPFLGRVVLEAHAADQHTRGILFLQSEHEKHP